MYTARNYTRYVNACDGVTAPMCLNQGNRFIHSGIKYGCLMDALEPAPPQSGQRRHRFLGFLALGFLGATFPSSLSFLLFVLPPPDHDIEQRRRAGNRATRCLNRELALRLVRVLMDGIFGKDLLGTNRFQYASARLRSSCIHH